MSNAIEAGERLFKKGKFGEAEKRFLQLLEAEPENVDLFNNLGVIAHNQKNFSQAAIHFSNGLAINPYHLDLIYNYCDLLKSINQIGRAVPLLEMALAKYSDDARLLGILADARISLTNTSLENLDSNDQESKISAGIDEFKIQQESLTGMAENDASLSFEKAQSAFNDGDTEQAASLLFSALTHNPHLDDARQLSERILSGSSESELKENSHLMALSLAVTFAGNSISNGTTKALKDFHSHLDDQQKTSLIDLLFATEPDDFEKFVIGLLVSMKTIDKQLAEKLGDWMQRHSLTRDRLDRIEIQICLKCSDDEIAHRVARRESAHDSSEYVVPGFETYPRRVVDEIDRLDPFMKLVPEGAPSKENGMKILVISDYNIAGQHTRLMRSLNKYSNHAVRCVIYQSDFLSYDRDVIICDEKGNVSDESMEEAASLIRGADFFHIGRQLCPISGIKWEKYISPRNAVFQYHGSHLRSNGPEIAKFHAENKFEAISCVDWSIYKKLQTSFYHLHPCMLELDELPDCQPDFSGEIRLVHAPSGENYRRIKRSDIIIETMDRLAGEIDYVQSEIVENVTNRECLELKSHCHVHIASLLMAFGLNAIESAAMGVIPVTTLDNFSRFIYHDTPVVHATKNNIYEVVKKLVSDRPRMTDLSISCREWARRKFDARTVSNQYTFLYDLIYHGLSVDYPNPEEN